MFIWKKLVGLFSSGPQNEPAEPPKNHVHLTSVQRAARRQIEFYFSPSNVQRDAFMKGLIDNGENRFCPINTFMRFNKISELGVTEDDLLIACESSHKLEVDKEHGLVRTVKPFQVDQRTDYRTIYIEGLDKDETLQSLRSYFEEQLGGVLYVGMKNYNVKGQKNQKKFSGKVDVELSSEKKASAAVESGIEYKGRHIDVQLLANIKNNSASSPKIEQKEQNEVKTVKRGVGRPPKFPKAKDATPKTESAVAQSPKTDESAPSLKKEDSQASPKKSPTTPKKSPTTPRKSPRIAKPKKSE